MAGGAVGQAECLGLEYAVPQGGKLHVERVAAQGGVDASDDFVQVVHLLCVGTNRGLDGAHEQCGGNALAHHVADGEPQVPGRSSTKS